MAFTVYLGIPYPNTPLFFEKVRREVGKLFQLAAARNAKAVGTVYVGYAHQKPRMSGHGVLVYLVWSNEQSIYRIIAPDRVAPQNGWTYKAGAEMGSEVYIKESRHSVRRLATVVFHEALHNLMDATDATLHYIGGPICHCEYEQAKNDKDIEKDLIIMSNAMMLPRPQWETGFDIVSEKLERDRQGKSSAITPFAMRPAWA
jgi:hypothetical protein